MAKPWKDVIASPEYQGLSPEQKQLAQTQYFEQVVAPQLPEDQLEAAKEQFFTAYPVNQLASTPTETEAVPEMPKGSNLDMVLEPLMNVAGSVVGNIAAGGAGIVESIKTGSAAEGGQKVKDFQAAVSEQFAPETQAGQKGMQAVGDMFKMVSDIALYYPSKLAGAVKLLESGDTEEAQKFAQEFQDSPGQALGDEIYDKTGNPIAATIAATMPTLVAEIAGLKGLKLNNKAKTPQLSSNVDKALQQAAPGIDAIKNRVTGLYDELDQLGVKVKPKIFDNFADQLTKKLQKEGVDSTLTPKSSAFLKQLEESKGVAKTATELDTLRKKAKIAASSMEKSDARLGNIAVKQIDEAIDSLAGTMGGKFKEARALHQRAVKSRNITDMIENASNAASGFENGLRVEARKILNNPKRRKGFNKQELDQIKKIAQGTPAANTAKFLGKFGISEQQATSMLGASIGASGGFAMGAAFGGTIGAGTGAAAVLTIGQLAKRTAQRLTLNNAKYADDLTRAGTNAKQIVRAYLKHTPAKKRSVAELTDLLLQDNVDISSIKGMPNAASSTKKLVQDAKYFAEKAREYTEGATAAGLVTSGAVEK
tara:strand:- start:4635 stop:6419 length:1785 start_codon:yes stop_codon:yes gene_type:complete